MEKLKQKAEKGEIDAWGYVKHIRRLVLWFECLRILEKNPHFILMEDGAGSHKAAYTNQEREKLGIPKAIWPPFSPDFNSIEHIHQ